MRLSFERTTNTAEQPLQQSTTLEPPQQNTTLKLPTETKPAATAANPTSPEQTSTFASDGKGFLQLPSPKEVDSFAGGVAFTALPVYLTAMAYSTMPLLIVPTGIALSAMAFRGGRNITRQAIEVGQHLVETAKQSVENAIIVPTEIALSAMTFRAAETSRD